MILLSLATLDISIQHLRSLADIWIFHFTLGIILRDGDINTFGEPALSSGYGGSLC